MKKILLLILLFCGVNQIEAHQDTLSVKVMTYNLRFGQLATLDQIAEYIKSFNPDFVALQEVDCYTHRELAPHQNGKDFISTLAYKSGLFALYGKTINYSGGYYGVGILSKYPYIDVKKVLLPNPKSAEERAILYATYEVGKDTLVFAVTHLDVNSENTRKLQAQYIDQEFSEMKYPIILGGDFNATPTEPAISMVFDKRWLNATNKDFSFPASHPDTKIDYIFSFPKTKWQLVRTQTIQSCLSDHLPIVSEIRFIK